jgi:hypothetical protein
VKRGRPHPPDRRAHRCDVAIHRSRIDHAGVRRKKCSVDCEKYRESAPRSLWREAQS